VKILQGTVVDGRIVVDGGSLAEGTKVTILDESDEPPYPLSAQEEAILEEADAEIGRGEFVTRSELLAEIQRIRG
jgi:hypothetical protein